MFVSLSSPLLLRHNLGKAQVAALLLLLLDESVSLLHLLLQVLTCRLSFVFVRFKALTKRQLLSSGL